MIQELIQNNVPFIYCMGANVMSKTGFGGATDRYIVLEEKYASLVSGVNENTCYENLVAISVYDDVDTSKLKKVHHSEDGRIYEFGDFKICAKYKLKMFQ